ncbi:GNAT family N-acetyltransferase [Halobium palmae]|uniref:GNAT family N-acetyltransferase n=1 Tax=Halobium palmae TaxID=1776492 RepID=A0ABD5S3C9_9EURY
MELTESLNFSHKDRKDIYDYVESNGTVREDEVRRALNLDPSALGSHVTILRRDGYIRKVGNKLQVAFTDEVEETHEADGLEYRIRAAGEEDRDGLIEVMRAVAEDGRYIEAETVAAMVDEEEVVLRHNELNSRMMFVATVDGETVGWVHLDLPTAEKLSHTAVLTVGVHPDYRGKGIGSTLLERGVRWADEHSFEKLYNSVPSVNDSAIEFLESKGWETEAVREGHYRIDGEYVDEVMMACDLR